jgi:hypothetical protein
MAELRHRMIRTLGNDAESLFVCTVLDCDRQVVLDHVAGSLMVLEAGLGAVHYGFSGPVPLACAVDGSSAA